MSPAPPTRGRAAGGRTDNVGAFAEGSWSTDAVTLTAGGRLDRWRIADGFLREHALATGAALTDLAFRRPRRLGADRPRGHRLARRCRR